MATITGNSANNVLTAINATGDTLLGLAGNDTLTGLSGNDVLDGGEGIDIMTGADGDDIYIVDHSSDTVNELDTALGGIDLVASYVDWTLGSAFENLTLAGPANSKGTGNAKNNSILGNDGNNTLDGKDGDDNLRGSSGNDTLIGGNGNDALDGGQVVGGNDIDQMFGGAGNDIYVVDHASDLVQEDGDTAADGIDLVASYVDWTLGSAFENLALAGPANINGSGNIKNNSILGNGGNNTLDGKDGDDDLRASSGNDTLIGGNGNDALDGGQVIGGNDIDQMFGGAGNDIYIVDHASDLVQEDGDTAADGIDLVGSYVSYSLNTVLGQRLENLDLVGTANINGTGNAKNNKINGNIGNNVLDGLGGDDVLQGLDGNDRLLGGTGNDALTGAGGNDILNGGAGDDSMAGDNGNDTYYVDSTGDRVAEVSNSVLAGVDTVISSITYSLNVGNLTRLEHLTLLGSTNLNGTGNSKGNSITGNIGNNVLIGLGGNDALDGRGGTDNMQGGDGNDTYWVDNSGDITIEALDDALAGIDTVNSFVNRSLGFGLENLNLYGTANINGLGNAKNNAIAGNIGNNMLFGGDGDDLLWGNVGNDTLVGGTGKDRLDGGLGADAMQGDNGDDTYTVDSFGDVVFETSDNALAGHDTVLTSLDNYNLTFGNLTRIEHLTLLGTANLKGTGNAKNNKVTGNTGNNVLSGGDGHDEVLGVSGNDTLIGDSGNDALISNEGRSTMRGGIGNDIFRFAILGAGNADTILDFNATDDVIYLNVQVFGALGFGSIQPDEFKSGNPPLPSTNANACISFNTGTGILTYDADGNGSGAAQQFATILLTGLVGTVTAADFMVV